ncbi:MAG TPA: SgcJ/EcaC family oxidoreductase [Gemmatimonadaceae bacterium]|nr:SgcJ/EcaC family oxidoreductase [Gemmatimonadaceae bacterium]
MLTEPDDPTGMRSTAEQTPEAVEARIRELVRQCVKAVAAKDTSAIVNIYAADGVLMVPNALPASGAGAIRGVWEGLLGLPNVSLTFSPTSIHVSGDASMAYDVGTYEFAFDGPNGRVEDSGKYLVVWEQRDGEWKVVADMFNTDRPAPGS